MEGKALESQIHAVAQDCHQRVERMEAELTALIDHKVDRKLRQLSE